MNEWYIKQAKKDFMLFSILYVFFHSLVMKKKYYFFELFSIQIVGFLKKNYG